ncbi:MAG: xanthine dehydrogenase family protein molybdopterin-binding subunit, partial [Chloroflexota bacterium]
AATTKRHPAIVRHRTGVTRDGALIAQEIEVVMDGGAYCTLTPVVLSRGAIHSGGPYRCPNVRIRARATRTNTPPNGAFRGFGAPQTEFAAETHLNRIADALGISPLEIRRRNVYRVGDTTPTGQVLRSSVAGEEVLERAAEAAEFERLRSRSGAARSRREGSGTIPGSPLRTNRDRVATGIGLALAWHGAGFTGSGEVHLASVASIELTAEGRIDILVASTEMGQGTKTIFPQLVADALDVPIEAVDIAPQDTAYVPDSGPTVASRTAMVVGGLLIQAAGRLRRDVESTTGGTFAQTYREYAREGGAIRIDQRFEPYPGVGFDDATYRGDAYPAFGWAACVATVDVDLDTGEVQVRDVVAVDDIGKVIHPVLAEGQVEGGTLQAVGYATIEEIKLRDGRYLNDRLATYIIPTSLDAPRITTILVEAPFDAVPHGAKGVGELPMDVGAPAVVAAIADATGAWITDLPASPERILAALAGVPSAAPLPPGASEPAPTARR